MTSNFDQARRAEARALCERDRQEADRLLADEDGYIPRGVLRKFVNDRRETLTAALTAIDAADADLANLRKINEGWIDDMRSIARAAGQPEDIYPEVLCRRLEVMRGEIAAKDADLAACRAALEDALAFIGVMFGDRDGNVPATVTTPLGIPVKLLEVVAIARAALATERKT